MRKGRAVAWWTVAILSWAIAAYGAAYLLLGERLFPPPLRESFNARPWGIYPHAFLGMLGLLLGPLQFHARVQARTTLHRRIGTWYVVVALLVGAVGLYMAPYSYGGWITHVGFGALAVALLLTTATGWTRATGGHYARHREWMIRSFALMFAAPTLRMWLPLLVVAHGGDFGPAYAWVSWLSWVPNLVAAEWYVRATRGSPVWFGGAPLAGGSA